MRRERKKRLLGTVRTSEEAEERKEMSANEREKKAEEEIRKQRQKQ